MVQQVDTQENKAVTVVNIASSWKYHEGSGPGQWVIKITGAGCPMHYRVTGSGGSDYVYRFSFNPLDFGTENPLPALGMQSFLVMHFF